MIDGHDLSFFLMHKRFTLETIASELDSPHRMGYEWYEKIY